jgi:putative DNA methylase
MNEPAKQRPRLLIEDWLPIAEIGEESVRERRSMTALPPTYYLHVWWARRPLVASRAAVLASLLPAEADRQTFMHMLGIHGSPSATRVRIDEAKRTGEDLGANVYGYKRAFSYSPSDAELQWFLGESARAGFTHPVLLDPTAGGGSIPFEAARLGLTTIANDLNPVAWLVLKATVEFPLRFGKRVLARYRELAKRFIHLAQPRFEGVFPPEPEGVTVDAYLWARTITCPYCNGLVPLSPNWKLDSKGTGVRLVPHTDDPQHRRCTFEIVEEAKDHSPGTVKGGNGLCPYPDCGRVIDSDEIKAQAQAGRMGQQLYTVVFKRNQVVGHTKAGKPKIKSIRGFRAPWVEDDVEQQVQAALGCHNARMAGSEYRAG